MTKLYHLCLFVLVAGTMYRSSSTEIAKQIGRRLNYARENRDSRETENAENMNERLIIRVTEEISDMQVPKSAGLIISLSKVLTTCSSIGPFVDKRVQPFNPRKLSVMTGGQRYGADNIIYRVDRIVPHKRCLELKPSALIQYDVAVLQILNKFLLLEGSAPFVPVSNVDDSALKVIIQSKPRCFGIGRGGFSGRTKDETSKVEVQLLSFEECEKRLCDYDISTCVDTKRMAIAAILCGDAKAGCLLDRGSPLYCGNKIVAIASVGHCVGTCGNLSVPILFTRVEKVTEFLVKEGSGGVMNKRDPILLETALALLCVHEIYQILKSIFAF